MTSDRRNIGILGGGQLAMMMTQSAKQMGFEVYVLDPTPDCPASHVGAKQMVGSFKDRTMIYKFVNDFKIDVLTYDIESVNVDALIEIVENSNIQIEIHPNPHILEMIQNKWTQHKFYKETGLPATRFESVDIWRPHFENGIVLKTKYGGYDGKGVWVINSVADFNKIIGDSGLPLNQFYAEEKVMIQKELALIMSIDKRGKTSFYPVVELTQENGICVSTKTPADISTYLTSQIRGLGERINIELKQKYGAYVGILAVELFLTMDNKLLINEISPRVHNSGHFTIEGCKTSQFTNHILTIMGTVSGECSLIRPNIIVRMTNVLAGKNYPEERLNSESLRNKVAIGVESYHWYHKKPKEWRDGIPYKPLRKLGHYTVIEDLCFEHMQTEQLNYKDVVEENKSTTKDECNVLTKKNTGQLVYVVMGSSSDLPQMKGCIELLKQYNIPFEVDIVSAHRTPHWMYEFAELAEKKGRVIIAAAGGAAHLPGMIASISNLPVIGVPIETKALGGRDSLYSIVQMPDGVPVATVGIGKSKNAAILAIKIMGLVNISKQIQKENREKVNKQRKEHVRNFLMNV